jgi:hypothetical protein
MLIELSNHPVESVFAEFIVVVEKSDKLACGKLCRGVRGFRDMSVLLTKDIRDTRIFRRVLLDYSLYVWAGRVVVRDTQLPILINLRTNGFNCRPKVRLRDVVYR